MRERSKRVSSASVVLIALLLGACSDAVPEASQPLAQFSQAEPLVATDPQAQAIPAEAREALQPQAETSEAESPVPAVTDARGMKSKVTDVADVDEDEAESTLIGAAAAETHKAEPIAWEMVASEAMGPINVYAGPATDWPVRAVIQPRERFTIVARAGGDQGSGHWLRVELLSGTGGWIPESRLELFNPADVYQLPRVSADELWVTVTVRDGATLRQEPDAAAEGCRIIARRTVAPIGGRSLDGQWLFVRIARGGCEPSSGREINEGWVRVSQLEPDPVISEAPTLLPYGLWSVSLETEIRPVRLPVEVRESYCGSNWAMAEGGKNVWYWRRSERDDDGTARLQRLSLETGDTTSIGEVDFGALLPAPTGGRVLVRGRTPDGHRIITVVDSSGQTVEVGSLYLDHQSDRCLQLKDHARWSADGAAIVFTDLPLPASVASDAPEFWLYDLKNDRRVILHDRSVHYSDAQFHPDGQSLFAVSSNGTVHRFTLDGEPWPDFQPIPNRYGYQVSPDGTRIITRIHSGESRVCLLSTNMGEPQAWRVGSGCRWFGDRNDIAYHVDGEWVIEQPFVPDGGNAVRRGFFPSRSSYNLSWSADSRYVADFKSPSTLSSFRWTFGDMSQLRIFDDRGRIAQFRVRGCARAVWSADNRYLVVAAFPCPGAP